MAIFVVEVTALFVNSWRIVPAWKIVLKQLLFMASKEDFIYL